MPHTRATGPEEQVNALAEAVDTLHTRLADQAQEAKEREDRLAQDAKEREDRLAQDAQEREDRLRQEADAGRRHWPIR